MYIWGFESPSTPCAPNPTGADCTGDAGDAGDAGDVKEGCETIPDNVGAKLRIGGGGAPGAMGIDIGGAMGGTGLVIGGATGGTDLVIKPEGSVSILAR